MKPFARLRSLGLVLTLLAAPSAFAALPFQAYDRAPVYVQERGQRADKGRPSRDRQESQRRQGERERGSSMTPDERRELNRDLQRANREFYRKGREGR
jgi:hypothetical protein